MIVTISLKGIDGAVVKLHDRKLGIQFWASGKLNLVDCTNFPIWENDLSEVTAIGIQIGHEKFVLKRQRKKK